MLEKLPLKITLNDKIYQQTIRSSRALAELNGCLSNIPNPEILINALVLQEAKDSSEIENIITTHNDLFLARLDEDKITKAAKEVKDYESALKKGFSLLKKDGLILNSHLKIIQNELVKNNAGFRKVSGTNLKNQQTGEIIYTPPQNPAQINELMSNLERYINEDLDEFDPLIKMALIHYQFECIHPFYDGNGRAGRILNILYLVHKGLLDLPILYLSAYIVKTKARYYELLQLARSQAAFLDWIEYILKGIESTAKKTKEHINNINNLMQETSEILKNQTKFHSKNFVELLFYHPYTKIDFVENKLNISRQSASKYLKSCQELGILTCIKIGRQTYFVNTKLVEIFIRGI